MEEGKLFVVIAVLSIIVVGLGVYLFFLDKRITALKKRFDQEKS